jgi:tetratricopeptide (TPR) repeat protein
MQLKPITREGIPAALQKAERYRLLNDSSAAESICLDILEIEPENQQALVMLLLSITDQFIDDPRDAVKEARDVLARLKDDYKRAYYAGIISERKAKALLHRGGMGVEAVAHDWFREAMKLYEKAEAIRPKGNDESILRWNTCARMLGRHEPTRPTRDEFEPVLGE